MQFNTDITTFDGDHKESIRGISLDTLVTEQSFVSSIFLLIQKRLPSLSEARMLDAILTTAIDHGAATASAMNARISASAKNPIHASLAAGILGFGERHGMAVEGHMKFLQDAIVFEGSLEELLRNMKEQKIRVPGFGHKVFETEDPRSTTLFALAKELDVFGKNCQMAFDTGIILNTISSRPLPLNVDGAIGAILLDMAFAPKTGNAIFLMARVPGLLAHIIEEGEQGNGIRRA